MSHFNLVFDYISILVSPSSLWGLKNENEKMCILENTRKMFVVEVESN